MLSKLIGTLVTVLYVLYILYKYVRFNLWTKGETSDKKPVAPVNDLISLLKGNLSIGEVFQNGYLKYKACRIFGMCVFFKPVLIITDPEIVQTVLSKEFKCFQDRGVFSDETVDPMSTHLFSMNGQKWHNLRNKLTPYFNLNKIKQSYAILEECSEELKTNLEGKAKTKACIDVKDMFERYTMDFIMATAFGIQSNCIKQQNHEFTYWGKQVFGEASIWKLLFMFSPNVMKFFSIPFTDKETSKFFMDLFQENMNYRKNNNIISEDFMNALIQLMEKGYIKYDNKKDVIGDLYVNKLTIAEAAAQAFGFFLAGYETSATTASYCLYELACNPDIQDKVRTEIDELLEKHGEISYEAANEMKYFQNVINETLRKYPPLSILFRKCTRDIDLSDTDIHISKETIVIIPVLGLHRDPTIYPDPDKFDPERFTEANKATRHSFAYLPFGQGPRMCMADVNKLTTTEAAAQAFDFFLAGYKTSATTASYCLYELACNPDKVRTEINELLKKHGEISYEAANEMKYFQNVINETLRKYPPLSILFRKCTRDIDLSDTDIHISKETIVIIPVLGLHRDPTIYPDPDKFDPERFTKANKATRHSFAYLPFGQGPRMCMGMKLAFLQIKMGLAKLLLKYKFKPHPKTSIPLTLDKTSVLIIVPKGGIHLTIEQR
ncbi:probable cytochrome P450 6a17 isoform X2 [Solenopsis invicta]|uniref:probable cytochrome P450 6a17 isoform X2 n=1 Tax=Solenopsis invicta TaxID=13686 RepID=UPI00193E7298|nr:probable cytochrome P450 6a17 isoform X2 [Solenopsis invicta]